MLRQGVFFLKKSNPFKNLLASGEYLQQMSHEELVKVLLLEYVKESIGKRSLIHVASQETKSRTSSPLF